MRTIIDKLLRHPVISSVVAAGIVAVFSGTLRWRSDITAALKISWEFITKPTVIPLWLLVLLLFFTSGFFLIIILLNMEAKSETNSFLGYKEDEFYGIKWRWEYYNNGSLKDPVPFCVNCDFQLVPHFSSSYHAIERWSFQCENCGHTPPIVEESLSAFKNRVQRQIELQIRNGTWQKKQNNTANGSM